MRINKICRLFCIAVVGCCILVSAADARYRGRRHHRGYRSRPNSHSVLARMYAEQLRAAAIRDAAVRAARAETARASTALYLAQIRLQREYQLSSSAVATANRLRLAQQELEAAHESVITELLKTPEYESAVKTKNEAIARIEGMKESDSSSPQWLAAVAARTAAASLVSRLEAAAFKNNETVQAATQRVDAALEEVKADRRKLLMSTDRMSPAKQRVAGNPWLPLGATGAFDAQTSIEATIRGDVAVTAASSDLLEARKQTASAYAAGNDYLAKAGRGRPNSRSTRPSRQRITVA